MTSFEASGATASGATATGPGPSGATATGVSRPPGAPRALVGLLAVSTGLFVASMYYVQPLLHQVGTALHLSPGTAGLVVTVTQLGYVAGLLLVVPLGDIVARRLLLPGLALALAGCLFAISVAGSGGVLLAASVGVGVLSVGAQVGVALVASLAGDAERGRVVGTVMSGLLLGILLARAAAGYLADLGSWRTPYQVAVAALVVLAVALRMLVPVELGRPHLGYGRLLASVGTLLREEPVLRRRAAFGAVGFGAFSVLWTPLAFLLSGPRYGYSTAVIGLFGLLGAVGAASASVAGRLADSGGAARVTLVMSLLLLVCWGPILLGATSVVALVVGVVVLDLAVQGLHITNQSVIYALRPEARSRSTSAYMMVYFAGGVVGSALSSSAYAAGGWTAVSGVGAAFGLAASWLALADRVGRARRRRPGQGSVARGSVARLASRAWRRP